MNPPPARFPTRDAILALPALLLLFALLAAPGFRFPIISDTVVYALTGESLWRHGTYMLFGMPYAKHLPLYGFLSYPFVWLFGYSWGMKTAALLCAEGTLLLTVALLRRAFSAPVALLAGFFLALQFTFVFETMVASSDILFTCLFLGSLLAFQSAEEEKRWYIAAGLLAGMASLTRYNGVPLFLLFPVLLLFLRRRHLSSPWFWGGMAAGGALLGLWFLRNALVFGNPLHSEYLTQWPAEAPPLGARVLQNVLYYANPIHNVFLLLPFALYGILAQGRKQFLLLGGMAAAWALTAAWWLQATRFALPGYPLLLGFAAFGLWEALRRIPRWAGAALLLAIVAGQVFLLGIYAYGSWNAAFDRRVGFLPQDLHLSSEGFYGWDQARGYLNAHARSGATVIVDGLSAASWEPGKFFRRDLQPVLGKDDRCPAYQITQKDLSGAVVLYRTTSAPITTVVEYPCPTGM